MRWRKFAGPRIFQAVAMFGTHFCQQAQLALDP